MHRCLFKSPLEKEVGLSQSHCCDISSALDRAGSVQKCSPSLALKYCYTVGTNSAPVRNEKMGKKCFKVACKIYFFLLSGLILCLKCKIYMICYSVQIDTWISNSHVVFLHIMDLVKSRSR